MDRSRYDDQLNRAGGWLLTLNDEQAIFGNGRDVKVALYVSNVSQFLGRAGALFQVSTDTPQIVALILNAGPCRSAGEGEALGVVKDFLNGDSAYYGRL